MKKRLMILITAGAGLGFLIVSCKDMGNQPAGTQQNQPPAIGIGSNSLAILAGDSASTQITGGVPPYSFVTKGDTTRQTPVLLGGTLRVHGIAAGSSTIVIGDNSTPQATVTVSVAVAAAFVSYAGEVQPIFNRNCTGCHKAGGIAPFSLEAAVSRDNLVNISSTSSCVPDFRVTPGNAAASVLFKKLTGIACGSRMPLGGAPLLSADLNSIQSWINQGALNN